MIQGKRVIFVLLCALAFVVSGVAIEANVNGEPANDVDRTGPSVPNLVIHEVVQVPKTVYVGDLLTLLIDCEAPERLSQNPSAADLLVPDDHLAPWTFDGLVVTREGDRVRLALTLRAWEPGFLVLPDLQLADAPLAGLSVEVSSVLDATAGDRTPAGARGSLLPPGTKLLVALFAGLVPLALLMLVLFNRSILPGLRLFLLRRPRRRILGQLRRLVSVHAGLSPQELLARFVPLVRAWLTLLCGRPLDAATPGELARLEQIDTELFAPALLQPHEAVLAFHDCSRFSLHEADWTSLDGLMGQSIAACEAADALLTAREREAGA